MFSAGVDLLKVVDGGAVYVRMFLPVFRRVFESLFDYPKPVVAAVNGHAIAGGCVLACAADHRVMAAGTARIGMPELLVGVALPTVALETVRCACPSRLRRLISQAARSCRRVPRLRGRHQPARPRSTSNSAAPTWPSSCKKKARPFSPEPSPPPPRPPSPGSNSTSTRPKSASRATRLGSHARRPFLAIQAEASADFTDERRLKTKEFLLHLVPTFICENLRNLRTDLFFSSLR